MEQRSISTVGLFLRRQSIICTRPHLLKHPSDRGTALVTSVARQVIHANPDVFFPRPLCPPSNVSSHTAILPSPPCALVEHTLPRLLPIGNQDPPPRHLKRLSSDEVVPSPRILVLEIQELEVIVHAVVAGDVGAF
jgi:hypothetical protein